MIRAHDDQRDKETQTQHRQRAAARTKVAIVVLADIERVGTTEITPTVSVAGLGPDWPIRVLHRTAPGRLGEHPLGIGPQITRTHRTKSRWHEVAT